MIDARAEIAERSSDGSARCAGEGRRVQGNIPGWTLNLGRNGTTASAIRGDVSIRLASNVAGRGGEIRGRGGTPSTARVETKLHAHVFVLTW